MKRLTVIFLDTCLIGFLLLGRMTPVQARQPVTQPLLREAAGTTTFLPMILNPYLVIGSVPLSAGETHTCARTPAGGVKCWGWNFAGQLGDGTSLTRNTPVDVIGLGSGVRAISSGQYHTCALMETGTVKCWGNNYYGQLGNGTTSWSTTPVDVVGLNGGVSAISAGNAHTCALLQYGGVRCWGSNDTGQLGDGTTTDSPTPVNVIGLSGEVSLLSARAGFNCVLTKVRGVKCWGRNGLGQLGDGTTTDKPSPVDVIGLNDEVIVFGAGESHNCVLLLSGEVKCWGWNYSGQLGDGTTTNRSTPVQVLGLPIGVIAITGGILHTCVSMQAGGVKCWGANGEGQLGDGTTTVSHTPVNVVGLTGLIYTISASGWHTCIMLGIGSVKCWGRNDYGELGDGTLDNRSTPVDVIGFP